MTAPHPRQLPREFFLSDPVTCAHRLIGVELRWDECAGTIIETEAYAAQNDEACHLFFKPSARAFLERNNAGAAYIYLNYGVHWMANVLCKGDEAGFVLIRAVEPSRGMDLMRKRRAANHLRVLCSGPGKLTQAFGIGIDAHELDLVHHPSRGFRLPSHPYEGDVLADVRIGISRATEHRWRFLAAGNPLVSVRPSPAARLLCQTPKG